jgi:hypothetical protein
MAAQDVSEVESTAGVIHDTIVLDAIAMAASRLFHIFLECEPRAIAANYTPDNGTVRGRCKFDSGSAIIEYSAGFNRAAIGTYQRNAGI